VWHATYARNTNLTYGGKTPLEIAFGRPPPDIVQLENMTPLQVATDPSDADKLHRRIAQIAQEAYQQTRQHDDIRKDLLQKLRPSEGPFEPGQSVWYWDRDPSKIRGGYWKPARVINQPHGNPMVDLQFKYGTMKVNQSKMRKNPDPWHDVVIPGLEGRDDHPTVPGQDRPIWPENVEPTDAAESPTRDPANDVDLAEPYYDFWLHNPNMDELAGFQQYCVTNDQLSAVLGQSYPVASPIFLPESAFTSLDSARCAAEVFNECPQVAWMTIPQRVNDELLNYVYHLAEHQTKIGGHFVIAHPYRSSLWNHANIKYLEKQPGVKVTTVDLNSYCPTHKRFSSSLCLLHNCQNLDILKKGGQKPKKSLPNLVPPSDDYPISFCQTVFTALAEAVRFCEGKINDCPRQDPIQTSLMMDLLEPLSAQEMQHISDLCQENCYSAATASTPHFSSISQCLSVKPTGVANKEIKGLMNWGNSLARGTIVNSQTWNDRVNYPTAWESLKRMREVYFPDTAFKQCIVTRGVLPVDLANQLRENLSPVLVFLWRKNSNAKQLFIASIQDLSDQDFEPGPWTIVMFFTPESFGGGPLIPGVTSRDNLLDDEMKAICDDMDAKG